MGKKNGKNYPQPHNLKKYISNDFDTHIIHNALKHGETDLTRYAYAFIPSFYNTVKGYRSGRS